MTPHPEYEVTPEAVADAKSRGIEGNVVSRLLRMASRSAPITHPMGNRRFEDYVLSLKGRVIDHVRFIDEIA